MRREIGSGRGAGTPVWRHPSGGDRLAGDGPLHAPAQHRRLLEASALLGALLVTGFHLAALRRTDLPETERRDFYLYVDEVHTFATLSLADILAEARKYRLCLVLTSQYLDQLDERIQTAVLGNVGTLITFRVGVRDAEVLAKEFWPDFDMQDLVSLPRYQIHLRLMIDGIVSKPFSAETLPPGP